ncbi:hypothetical protein NOGI109294_23935 [Nocardiopsis gilva]
MFLTFVVLVLLALVLGVVFIGLIVALAVWAMVKARQTR